MMHYGLPGYEIEGCAQKAWPSYISPIETLTPHFLTRESLIARVIRPQMPQQNSMAGIRGPIDAHPVIQWICTRTFDDIDRIRIQDSTPVVF
jgi:hypothetical protein